MSITDTDSPLFHAVRALLTQLVRLLLARGVALDSFAEIARRTYVHVAETSFGIAGRKQTTSPRGFSMHNRPIEFSSGTRFERAQADALRADQRVFVEGVYRAGALAAARVVGAEGGR